ncbi:MAG: baseplate J/gp47 family protein [Patescibacteria group bacterium]|nr:baseplate J/gp47 family protein [Patescibacteria group bacterium]MCL5261957.1 baseplate J/gp47 family protein [Patescibacteria group bacterium]
MDKSENKKIYLKRSETAASIIQKILNARELKVTLVVPKDSVLAENGNNFYLIFREASAMGKQVNIESSDDDVINLALASGFQVINPVFKKVKRAVADIIPVSAPVKPGRRPRVKATFEEKPIPAPAIQEEPKEESEIEPVIHEYEPEPGPASPEEPRRPRGLKKIVLVSSGIVLAGVLAYAALYVLPRADVKLTLVKTAWETPIGITASTKANTETGLTIPGQVFAVNKNNVFSAPASGTKKVAQSATGIITVYNAYSSSKQSIVKGTRFITTGGKVFKTTKAVTIPAAAINEGKIVPSSIDVEVAAEKPGTEYNLAAGQSWRIPGFEGTPKFNGFYGESKEAMAGGFVGDVKVPTEADIAALRERSRQELLAMVKTAGDIAVPEELKTINGATSYAVVKEEVVNDVDENGNFKMVLAAETKIMAFDEKSVRKVVEEKLKTSAPGEGYEMKNYEIRYGEASVNFGTGKAIIPLTIVSEWIKIFDAAGFKAAVAGKSEGEVNNYVVGNPEIRSAVVTLWPFWVRSVPRDADRVILTLE